MADLQQQPLGGTLQQQPLSGGTTSSGIPIPVGQTVLTANPGQQALGKNQAANEWAQSNAYNAFVQQAGRAPTQQELSQLAPSFAASGDPNVASFSAGNAAVASYLTQQTNTPQNIYNQQQSQYTANAPKYADQVQQAFQSSLGRQATADELTHFGALMASGQDAYQVQQALAQTQEGQNKANTDFQNQLQGQLQQSNSTYFNQYIAPSLQAQAAQSGRSLDSSGVNAQLANAALQQNQGLQTYLAGVTAQNYQNSTANATNQYNQLMGQQYGLQNAGVSNALSNQASNTQYNQNLSMYQMQQNAYSQYLQNYGKTNGFASTLQGALGGAAAGAKFGPYGALAGGLAGGGLGAASANSGGNAQW